MIITDQDIKEIEKLEESLWKSETRFDSEYMDQLLHADFFEFGRSGRIYQRQDTLDVVSAEEIKIQLPLKNFSVHTVDDNSVLVTYISEVMYEELEVGNRTSLWVKTEEGWKLRFHQGTPV